MVKPERMDLRNLQAVEFRNCDFEEHKTPTVGVLASQNSEYNGYFHTGGHNGKNLQAFFKSDLDRI